MTEAQIKPTVGCVEVLKDEGTRMWYSAQVLDMVGKDKLLVGFDNNVWPKQELPYSRVRKLTKQSQAELDKFNPRVGDEVELRINATEHQPAAWGAAVVKNIKHSFYFVTRLSNTGPDGQAEAIVEKSMLRALIAGSCFDSHTGDMKTETFKVAPGLRDWISTDDAVGCFSRIEADSGLMFIKVGRNELKLVGDEKAAMRARMLLDVHQKHQVQIQNFQDMREKRLSALEKRRNRIEGTGYKHSIEIQIDPNFVRRVIGTKGETIRAVMQKYEVNIHIPDEEEASPTRTVRIFGNNMDNIEKARGEVEFIEEVYPETIEPATFNWLRGRGDKTIKMFKEMTGIVYARLDRDTHQLIVCGTRNAVEEAMAMFETHMMYYPVFSQMDEEMEQLVCQLEEHGDYQARYDWGWCRDEEWDDGYRGGKSSGSKGKSKGGGKDSGKGKGKAKGNDSWNDSWKDKGRDDWKNDWKEEDDWKNDWKPQGKSSKGGKGGKGKGGKAKDWDDDEQPKGSERPAKGGGKNGKSGGKASRWQEEEEEAWEEEPELRGRGRGKASGRGTRGVYIAKEDDEDASSPAAKPARGARMGKKGIRS